ncbi:MAG: hypothetical protein AAF485_12855, partial [Chloroflexota bacterium]
KNWLLYQMGRRETSGGWNGSGLGQNVINDIDKLQQVAKRIAERIYGGDTTTDDQIRQVHIMLTRRYVGYLKRWFVGRGGQQ